MASKSARKWKERGGFARSENLLAELEERQGEKRKQQAEIDEAKAKFFASGKTIMNLPAKSSPKRLGALPREDAEDAEIDNLIEE